MSMRPLEDLYGLASDVDRETLERLYEQVLEYVPVTALNDLYYELLDIIDGDQMLNDDEHDQFRDDVEADADALASAGWGTDEDYGYYGDE